MIIDTLGSPKASWQHMPGNDGNTRNFQGILLIFLHPYACMFSQCFILRGSLKADTGML